MKTTVPQEYKQELKTAIITQDVCFVSLHCFVVCVTVSMYYLSLGDWLISLSVIVCSCIHPVAGQDFMALFMTE